MNETVTHFATKHDLYTEIGNLITELKKDITDLRIEVKQDLSNLALKIGFIMVGNVTVTVGLLTLVLKLAGVI